LKVKTPDVTVVAVVVVAGAVVGVVEGADEEPLGAEGDTELPPHAAARRHTATAARRESRRGMGWSFAG
jgi:hypothetical protein